MDNLQIIYFLRIFSQKLISNKYAKTVYDDLMDTPQPPVRVKTDVTESNVPCIICYFVVVVTFVLYKMLNLLRASDLELLEQRFIL